MPSEIKHVLVTGATGFIGAHVVDVLLEKGLRVRGTTRSAAKGQAMIEARPEHKSKLEFIQIGDFSDAQGDQLFHEAVQGIDGIIHVASPLTYDTKDNEKELILPAINGVRAILAAAASTPTVQRLVLTSSFASVVDLTRQAPPYFTYTGKDWNPLTYAEAADPASSAVVAYRGAKKFAELAAWDFARGEAPGQSGPPAFDVVALCPPMTFGPVRHPVGRAEDLNESNSGLWKIACGMEPLPQARVPFWIDVRDLALAHAEALLRAEAGGKRYIPASPERFSYGLAARIIREEFEWAREVVASEEQAVDESHGVDGETAAMELGIEYRTFRQSVVDLVKQARDMST